MRRLSVLLAMCWLATVFAVRPVPAADITTVKETDVLGGFTDWVTSVECSADGKLCATGTHDKVVLWETSNWKNLKEFTGKLGRVRSLAFSADGKSVLAGGYQKIVAFDVASGASRELKGHRGFVTTLITVPGGQQLLSASEDGTVRQWDLASGASKVVVKEAEDPIMGLALSADGKRVATASGDETRPTRPGPIKLYDLTTGEHLKTLEAHQRVATTVAFSPDGKLLASGGFDGVIKLHKLEDATMLGAYDGHERPINQLRFTPDGKQIVSAAGGRAVGKNEAHVWDVVTGKTIVAFTKHEAPVLGIALLPDGKRVVSVSRDQTGVVWERPAASSNPLTQALSAATKLAATVPQAQVPQGSAKDEADKEEPKPDAQPAKAIKIGMIGLDTSHCIAFAQLFNAEKSAIPGFRVTLVYPQGSPDIKSSVERVPDYTTKITALGVQVINSLEEMVSQVDAVLLETNDGRPHLEQVIPVLKAGKPVFIDKPIAGSLIDAVAIFELSRHYKTPLFSSSSLRFASGAQALRNGKIGDITGCDAYSPCSLEATHPDLFWYGIHGVETLFTVMGAGCESVSRTSTKDFDFVAGTWKGGRIGTFRGIRSGGSGYGGTAFGTKGVSEIGKFDGYQPLAVEIGKFFQTKVVPVSEQETLEIYAFMEAADESKRQGGKPVTLDSVLSKARTAAAVKVQQAIEKK